MSTAEKARALRLSRLHEMLVTRMDKPAAALEVLLAELKLGESTPELWEKLHVAAVRDGKEQELAQAYRQGTAPHRLKALEPATQAELLMHASNYVAGILGDRDAAQVFLERVLEVTPDHPEAFERLERKYQDTDKLRLAELYAGAVAAREDPEPALVRKTLNTVEALPSKLALSEQSCQRLLTLASSNEVVLDVLDAHCRKTQRPALACALLERALIEHTLRDSTRVEKRRRLAELYATETDTPEKAIDHVETLLVDDPTDAKARAVAERLLSNRNVSSRAAAAIQRARRETRRPP